MSSLYMVVYWSADQTQVENDWKKKKVIIIVTSVYVGVNFDRVCGVMWDKLEIGKTI